MRKASVFFVLLFAALILLIGCIEPLINAPEPPETPPLPPDPCEGITCEGYCDEFTLLSNGECVNGECVYASREENSEVCGFVSEPKMSFDTNFAYCRYDKLQNYYLLFFTIRNQGEMPTKENAFVQLTGEGIGKKNAKILTRSYDVGRILWEEFKWDLPYKGMEWIISSTEQKVYSFKLLYCEIDFYKEECTEENGVLLYEGDTSNCE